MDNNVKNAVPDWVAQTPREHEYLLQMCDEYDGDRQTVVLTRNEFVNTKAFIAGLRGFSVTPRPNKESGNPEWVSHTPEESEPEPNAESPFYALNMCDGTGEVPQGIFLSRAEFLFLKQCLAARQECIPCALREAAAGGQGL